MAKVACVFLCKKEEGKKRRRYHPVPVMIILKLKLVMFPAFAEAVNVSVAETEVLGFRT